MNPEYDNPGPTDRAVLFPPGQRVLAVGGDFATLFGSISQRIRTDLPDHVVVVFCTPTEEAAGSLKARPHTTMLANLTPVYHTFHHAG